jgi:hypothetical protein
LLSKNYNFYFLITIAVISLIFSDGNNFSTKTELQTEVAAVKNTLHMMFVNN